MAEIDLDKIDRIVERFCYQSDASFSLEKDEMRKTLDRVINVGLITREEADAYLEEQVNKFKSNPYKG